MVLTVFSHCVTLPNRKDLGSVRDLRGEHVEFLEKMERETVDACQKKYSEWKLNYERTQENISVLVTRF